MPYEPMKMLAEFHDYFGIERERDVADGDKDRLITLRRRLIEEECQEAADELARLGRSLGRGEHGRDARVALAKELADVLYVTYGAADVLGIDLQGAFEAVHRSNMSKLGADGKPVRREDGKLLKGPGYREADVERFVPDRP
jgi:predicted HAD superfamily Cof-like phosphohydrolase